MGRRLFATLVATALIAACGNVTPALMANGDGNRAYVAGQYQAALNAYDRAYQLASASGDRQRESIALYGMARSSAQLCRFTDADRWFRQSIESRNALPDTPEAYRTQNTLEYARFLISYGRVSDALPFLDRAMTEIETTRIARTDPIGYADALAFYADALQSEGRQDEANAAQNRASNLRSGNPGRVAGFRPERYPGPC